MIEYLISQGLDMNITSDDLGTPVDWAVAYSQLDSAKYLFKQGAKISLKYFRKLAILICLQSFILPLTPNVNQ